MSTPGRTQLDIRIDTLLDEVSDKEAVIYRIRQTLQALFVERWKAQHVEVKIVVKDKDAA